MKKRISALVIAMLVFMCSSSFAFAAESDIVPYHDHKFSRHQQVGSEYKEYQGNHTYLYGYDEKGNEIFRDNCQLYAVYRNCVTLCLYCDVQQGSQHRHMVRFDHSISHK